MTQDNTYRSLKTGKRLCRPCKMRWQREARRKDPLYFWNKQLKSRYGIVRAEYEAIFDQQGGMCAICGVGLKRFDRGTVIDHCHRTGRVRGILCLSCNTAIGMLRESSIAARALADYLER